jgi:hypothetical protein
VFQTVRLVLVQRDSGDGRTVGRRLEVVQVSGREHTKVPGPTALPRNDRTGRIHFCRIRKSDSRCGSDSHGIQAMRRQTPICSPSNVFDAALSATCDEEKRRNRTEEDDSVTMLISRFVDKRLVCFKSRRVGDCADLERGDESISTERKQSHNETKREKTRRFEIVLHLNKFNVTKAKQIRW